MSLNYITTTSALTAFVTIPGIMMDKTTNVFLSSGVVGIPGALTAINGFTTNHKVSALFPVASAYNYPYYNILNKNFITVNVYGLSGTGLVDILVYNQAGYSKLSKLGYLIQYSDDSGYTVMTTENGNALITENGFELIVN
jgi:hypothetical protein